MSHSSSTTIASTTQPLSDILPWGAPISVSHPPDRIGPSSSKQNPASSRDGSAGTVVVDARTLLVADACSTDGRFLLHALALQFSSASSGPIVRSAKNSPPTPGAFSEEGGDGADARETTTQEGAVLWLGCAPVAEKQISTALRRGLQHGLGGGNATGVGKGGRVHIVSILLELADAALRQEDDGEAADNENGAHGDDETCSFAQEGYLKHLHQRIVHWLDHRELLSMTQTRQQRPQAAREKTISLGPNLVVVDDATALATLFGSRSTDAFLSSVRASLRNHARRCTSRRSGAVTAATTSKNAPAGRRDEPSSIASVNLLAVRASSPDDGGLYQIDADENAMKGERLRSEYARLLRPWLGFGSGSAAATTGDDVERGAGIDVTQTEERAAHLALSPHSPPSAFYRCGLYESADCVADVSPLESGYARDVLGRLSFATTWNGGGWWGRGSSDGGDRRGNAGGRRKEDGAYSSICVNYRCDDSGVRVMRLRTG